MLTAIKNGKIVTPEGILENKILLIEKDRIKDFADDIDDSKEAERVIDAHGRFITPGFIDIHSDRIEQCIQPRPTSQIDFELAFKECERELLHLGITTMYHSLSLYKDEFFGKSPLRTRANVQTIADLIENIHHRFHLIHHRFHLRIEIDNLEAFDIVRSMLEKKKVHEISFMDHTPGQGQYRDLAIYEDAVLKYRGKEIENWGIDGIVAYHRSKPTLSFGQLKELCDLAHENGIAVASHDDDCEDKLTLNEKIGVDISEFPILIETAKAAKKKGFSTVVGAPNILLGGSHSGNMSAAQAILEGCADILCSDYYPPGILHGIFIMHKKYGVPLHEMVNKATLNPARAMNTDGDYGSLQIGKKADILIIDLLDGYPVVTHALVDGNATSRVEYRR